MCVECRGEVGHDELRRTFTRVKSMLTRAERSGKPARMLEAVAEARRTFDAYGWPDWWSRVDRLEDDAYWRARDLSIGAERARLAGGGGSRF